jgi:hypothetical protein
VKYLFIDTNNFMACALLTESGHTPQTIDQLINLLDGNQINLVLPEIVEIEFFREVDLELSKVEKHVKGLKDLIDTNFPTYLKPDKDQFMTSAQDIYSKRKASSQAAKAKLTSLFGRQNVIKTPLSPKIFIDAYKRAMSGKKPSKTKYCSECGAIKQRIDADCMIFESILSIKSEFEDNELIFCSANKEDFALYDKKQDKHFLHPDIVACFSQKTEIKYYIKLVDALKAEFNKTVNREEKEKINKYFQWHDLMAQLRNQADLAASLSIQGIAKQAAEANSGVMASLKNAVAGSLAEMIKRQYRDPLAEAIKATATPSWQSAQRQIEELLRRLSTSWDESLKKTSITAPKKNKSDNEKK